MTKWKKITGHTDYEISDDGRVRSHKWGQVRELAPVFTACKYVRVKLCMKGVQTPALIHRLVAKAFIANPSAKPDVNHKNSNKTDNRVSNLEWVTKKENLHHAMRSGTHANPFVPIQCVQTGQKFESVTAAATALGVFQANVSKVLAGQRPHTCGYTFKRLI